MTVRKWVFTDIAKIEEFEKKQMFPDRWNYEMLASSFLNDAFYGLIAEDENGETLGVSAVNFAPYDADIVNVLVAGNMRRKGVGSFLMEEMLKACVERGLKSVFLEVRESNYPAINLYKKYGFNKVSERKKYYQDGETAVVMKKDFV